MLDSAESQQINIRSLTLAEAPPPPRHRFFDPKRDISAATWHTIDAFIEQYAKVENQPALFNSHMQEDVFIQIIAALKIVSPDKISQFPLDSVKVRVFQRLNTLTHVYNNTIALGPTLAAVQLYDRNEVNSAMPETFHQWLLRLAVDEKSYKLPNASQLVFGAHILHPDQREAIPFPPFSEELADELEDIYQEEGAETWVSLLRSLKYTHPEEVRKMLTDDKKYALIEYLHNLSEMPRMMEFAKSLSILSADRVEIGKDGKLELIYDTPTQAKNEALPVVKNAVK